MAVLVIGICKHCGVAIEDTDGWHHITDEGEARDTEHLAAPMSDEELDRWVPEEEKDDGPLGRLLRGDW